MREISRFNVAPPRVFPLSVRTHPRTVLSTNTSSLVDTDVVHTQGSPEGFVHFINVEMRENRASCVLRAICGVRNFHFHNINHINISKQLVLDCMRRCRCFMPLTIYIQMQPSYILGGVHFWSKKCVKVALLMFCCRSGSPPPSA